MFTLTVDAIFTLRGRGIAVMGTVTDGQPPPAGRIGQIQQMNRPPLMVQITGYPMADHVRLPALDLLLRGVDKDDVAIGTPLTFVPVAERVKMVRARVTLLTPADGGRRRPMKPGYRDHLPLQAGILGHSGAEFSHRCIVQLRDGEQLWPGDERTLWLQVWCVPELDVVLTPGAPFALTEGQIVARGTVIEVRDGGESSG